MLKMLEKHMAVIVRSAEQIESNSHGGIVRTMIKLMAEQIVQSAALVVHTIVLRACLRSGEFLNCVRRRGVTKAIAR